MKNYIFILFLNKKEVRRVNFYNIDPSCVNYIAQGMAHGAYGCGKKCPGVMVFAESDKHDFVLDSSLNGGNCPDYFNVNDLTDIPQF